MAKTVKITRGQLRQIVKEEAARLVEVASAPKSEHDWDYFVHMTAYEVQHANQREEDWDGPTIADEVFRPSDDETVRTMRDASGDPAEEELIDAAVMKYAGEMGLDSDELRDAFYEGLDATEEYMGDDDDDDEEDDDGFDRPPFTVDVLVDEMMNGQDAVSLSDLRPEDAEAFRTWFASKGAGDIDDDERRFMVHKGSGFVVAFDDVDQAGRLAMLLPGLEEWQDYDGDEALPFDEDDEEMTGPS